MQTRQKLTGMRMLTWPLYCLHYGFFVYYLWESWPSSIASLNGNTLVEQFVGNLKQQYYIGLNIKQSLLQTEACGSLN